MIGHRLVRDDTVGTAFSVIKNLRHIWSSGLPHLLLAGVVYTHLNLYRAEGCDKLVVFTTDVTSIFHHGLNVMIQLFSLNMWYQL